MDCIKCGECCKRLDLIDCLKIFWCTKKLNLTRVCMFLTKDDMCLIQESKPKVCRDWVCGVSFL